MGGVTRVGLTVMEALVASKDRALLLHRREHGMPYKDSPIKCSSLSREQVWRRGVTARSSARRRVAQPVRTARASHPQHAQCQLTGRTSPLFAVCEKTRVLVLDAVFVKPAHLGSWQAACVSAD
jgi:hypothetical protein